MNISFATNSVTVLKPTMTIIRGSEVQDWSNPVRNRYSGCYVHPTTTGFNQDGRMAVSNSFDVLFPSGADVVAGDRVEYSNEVYTVVGVEPWESPTGSLSHLRVMMEVWHG